MPPANRIVVEPKDTGAALINPGMGWVHHFYDNNIRTYGNRLSPEDTADDFPGLSVVYLRLAWSYVEPRKGRFNWAVVDGPAQRFIAKGKQAALCFTCCESHDAAYATPEWVKDAGARGYFFDGGKPGTRQWEPDYDDPIFLAHLEDFLAAAAARYDGNPNVAFIDAGSYGVWGEGHTYHSTKRIYPTETIRKHINLHEKYFKKTIIALNDDLLNESLGRKTCPHTVAFAREFAKVPNFTLRDNSIMVEPGEKAFKSAAMAEPFWPNVPVILESEHYGGSKQRGYWGDGSKYIEAMEAYHASYVSIHYFAREFLAECRELVEKMNRRLGYRIRLHRADWPAEIKVGDSFDFKAIWSNAGVAPCYRGGCPAVTLKNAAGGIVTVFADERFNVRDLPVGPPEQTPRREQTAAFSVPTNVAAGEYDLFISVGLADGTPVLALPLDGDDGQRRYRMGKVTIAPA